MVALARRCVRSLLSLSFYKDIKTKWYCEVVMWSKKFVGCFVFMLFIAGNSHVASAVPSKIFKNCVELNSQFYYGVAKDEVSTISMGNDLLHISLVVYNSNRKLDIDNDGVVCEVESLQRSSGGDSALTKNLNVVTNVLAGGVFRNCSQLNRTYKYGVALNSLATGEYPAKISRAIYLKYSNLDFDDDGIVCEKEKLQNATVKKTVPVATIPVATIPVATVPRVIATTPTSPPLPTSPQRVDWNTGGTLNFRNGVTYIIVVCLSGQRTTSYLEVLTTATGWTTKAVGQTYIDKTVCSEIKFPFVLEWSWKVTETAGQATKMRILPWLEEMNVVVS